MFGDKFNFGSVMKNFKKIQEMMEQTQGDLENIEITGEAGAGAVKIIMNAKFHTKQVILDDHVIQEPKQILEELIAAAYNNAARKIETIAQNKMMDASKILKDFENEDKK